MCTSVEYTRFIYVYLIIVFINGMSIVYVQMFTIDVCYCVNCLRIVLCMCFRVLRGYGVIVWNLRPHIMT